MKDENPIRTLGDYSRPSHEGYRNTIELPEGNNVLFDPTPSGWIHLHMGGSYYPIPCSILSTGKDRKTPQRYPDVPTTSWRSLSEAWTRFKDLLQKVPHHGIDLWLQVQIIYDHVNPVTRRTINQSAGGKLRDLNPEESWAILEDLALYNNEIWNDPRDFAKQVKAIAFLQDVPSTSDRRLIKLEKQFQRLMELHLALTRLTQVNKITTLCEIYSGPHDTQYCIENPEQAFVEYASSRTDEARGLVSEFMASQNARLSKLEADFKQQQSEMTNKIDIMLKAITNQIAGTLSSDTVKNPKLRTHPVLSARSYPIIDPQCSSHSSTSINAIKAHFNEAIIEPQQTEEPKPTLDDEFRDLHLNLPDLVAPLLVGRGFLVTANAVIDFKVAKIAVGEGITMSVFSVKGIDLGDEEAPYWTTLGKIESYKPRPSTDGIGTKPPYYESEDLIEKPIDWSKPSKNEDGAWHDKIRIIDPDGEEFTKTLQSIPTTRKIYDKESLREFSVFDYKLYLMRRSLEVLRKFHWMILGGLFNQLSHVSSPLLSKPGESPTTTAHQPSVRINRSPDISSFGQFGDLSDNHLDSSFRQSGSIASPGISCSVFRGGKKEKKVLTNRTLGTRKGRLSDDRPGSQNVHRRTLARSARRHLHAHGASTQSTRRSDAVTAGRFIDVSSMYVDIGDYDCSCQYCGAKFWYGERLK
nr:MAK10-like protein [Tanacetum cinerariifolium]GEX80752.1 MAK10-like protein [Tanacetum cinerariifolium]